MLVSGVEETPVSDVKETNLQLRIDAPELKSLMHVLYMEKGGAHEQWYNLSDLFVLKAGF